MDIETNKIAGAVLSTLLVVMGLNMISGIVFAPHKPAVPGFDLPSEEPAAAAGAAAPAADEPIAVRLAKADPARGEKAVGACKACHTFEKGGPNKVGPHLYDVYGRGKGSVEGFGYSAAMKGKAGENWEADAARRLPEEPQGLYARHHHGLRRHQQARYARRCRRLSQHAGGRAQAAAQGIAFPASIRRV